MVRKKTPPWYGLSGGPMMVACSTGWSRLMSDTRDARDTRDTCDTCDTRDTRDMANKTVQVKPVAGLISAT